MEEKITVQVASKALNVSQKTIRRYIERGILSKVKEDGRVYVQADEVRSLRSGQWEKDKIFHVPHREKVTMDRTHYDGLLTRLGQLEGERQFLLEYRKESQRKDEEILETRKWMEDAIKETKKVKNINACQDEQILQLKENLRKLQDELNRAKKRGLIRRIFNK